MKPDFSITRSNAIGGIRQNGAVLFVALIFLVILTLIALTASSTSILQERMAGGMRNRQLGLMGSESDLRGGEAYLWNLSYQLQNAGTGNPLPPCVTGTTNCVYQPRNGLLNSKVQTFRTSTAWLDPSSDGARAYTGAVSGLTGTLQGASLASQPRFLIEDLGADTVPSAGRTGGSVDAMLNGLNGVNHLYRLTARSQGGSDSVIRVTESVFSALDFRNSGFGATSP